MPWELLYIFHDDGAFLLPGGSTYSLSLSDSRACNRPLKWTQVKLILVILMIINKIEAYPPPVELLFQGCCNISGVSNEPFLIRDKGENLRQDALVVLGLGAFMNLKVFRVMLLHVV